METMTVAFRDLPMLPPSPAVARRVRSEIRSGGSPFRRFGSWLTTSRSAPAMALSGAVVALVLVVASVFGPFDRTGNQPTVNAPNFAAQAISTGTVQTDVSAPVPEPTRQINVQIAPTSTSANSGVDVAMQLPTTAPDANAAAGLSGGAAVTSAEEPSTVAQASVPEAGVAESHPTVAPSGDGTGGGGAPVASQTPPPQTTFHVAAAASEAPADKTATPASPTPAPSPTATQTPPPAPTETPTIPPTSTATNTPEPTATVSPTETPPPTETATPDTSAAPPIVPRNGETPTDSIDAASADESQANASAAETAGSGPASSPGSQIEPRDQSSSRGKQTAESEATTSAPVPAQPLNFGDLPEAGFSIAATGSLIPGNAGLLAVEHPGGGMEIVDNTGGVLVSGYGYNPVWSADGSTLYTAGGAISEGSSAINDWTAAGGPGFVTDGSAIDTPAGDQGGLLFVRYQPDGDPVLSLWRAGGDAPVWQSNDYQLSGQTIYLAGGFVFVPTDQGWLTIPAGGGDAALTGAASMGSVDEVILSPDQSQVAFISGGTIYVAPATNPANAVHVADTGNGGVAWTDFGLVIASGDRVMLWTGSATLPLVTGGGDLTAPVWANTTLAVADRADGGAARLISADQIQAILAGQS